jgi:hypothetical protein
MTVEKGSLRVLIKAALFALLVSSISVAQDNTAPKSADTEGSCPRDYSRQPQGEA